MTLPFTSVVSLHTDPYSCGVARFSMQLAERLGVPFVDRIGHWGDFPLLSLKWSEVTYEGVWSRFQSASGHGVFWHDHGDEKVNDLARIIYYADPSLGSPGLWCPSLIDPPKRAPLKLFSFGMAHKCQPHYYAQVRELLDHAGLDYHLRVSVGLHEGTSLSNATKHFDALKEIMGPEKVTILGILSDEAVNLELRDCDYVLAFFEKGLRANNTTVHAALNANKPVITNHDDQTPSFLRASTRDIVGRNYWERTIPYYYSWERLLEEMSRIYAQTSNRHAHHL